MDFIKIKVSDLAVGQDIMWRGKVCQVVKLLGLNSVRVQEYKDKKVALSEFKGRWYTVDGDIQVDRVITR